MKIDEKVVSYFESSDSPVDKEGYLFKKGDIRPSYHKRWFVLKGNLLFYKDHPDDRDLIGVIVLEGCTVQLCESEEQFAFSLVWSELGLRPYKFAAEDQAGQESWIKALLSANHGYLSLLVMDLEKKYKETLEALFIDPANGGATPNADRQLSPQLSTLTRNPAGAVAAGPIPSSMPTLKTPPAPLKSTVRRSPKLWPKRTANVTPITGPAPATGDWSAVCSGNWEEFSKLHDDFGKEVKDLIADWSRSKRTSQVTLNENLIDLSGFE
ncbi:sesquipedalian-1-like [Phycodurus eques]|uniref:sesquipedalian-1-like n=1 Tax=Phycodurus eques TaxID=693459 RepID=UPI002ACD5EF3|nr:sesquipedalian-1-like [Phycodurus eques]XP_061561688.1 sesquipedalian-1-like [Phycodurus eques]XP_061561689.1 sesquipedalian-1-like [Phycodurus eques]